MASTRQQEYRGGDGTLVSPGTVYTKTIDRGWHPLEYQLMSGVHHQRWAIGEGKALVLPATVTMMPQCLGIGAHQILANARSSPATANELDCK